MKNLKSLFAWVLLIMWSSTILTANAESITDKQKENFRTIYEVKVPDLEFPKVVEVIIPTQQEYNVIVTEKESNEAQPIEIISEYKSDKAALEVSNASATIGTLGALFDGDFDTTLEFDLDKDDGHAFIELDFDKKISLSSFSLYLDKNVTLPYATEIKAFTDNNWKTVLNKTVISYPAINFQTTDSNKWRFDFWHSQPLRIKEISFYDEGEDINFEGERIIWLAQPATTYLIYSDASSSTFVKTSEKPDLMGEENKLSLEIGNKITNINYKEPDFDSDGVPDFEDNCAYYANENQEDLDKNKIGDVCDDHDLDGVFDAKDNCPNDPNRYQKDTDNDGMGDECDDEESRITEKFFWLPWAAMGLAATVVVLIIFQTIRRKK